MQRLAGSASVLAGIASLALLWPAPSRSNEAHHPDAASSMPAVTSPTTVSVPGASSPAGNPPATAAPSNPPAVPGSSGMQGMMEMMPKMMEGMMGGARKELYPYLMGLPSLTSEQRAEVQQLAEERIYEGMVLLQEAQERLASAVESGDHDAARQALQQSRDGIGRVDSGVAAHRLLRQGKPPQAIASQWFKREMSLAATSIRDDRSTVLGVLPLHLFVMALLVTFVVAMLVMYFFKMRRAAALFGRIEPKPDSPPAGGSPRGSTPGGGGPPSTIGATPASTSGTSAAAVVLPEGLRGKDAAPSIDALATSLAAPASAKWQGQLRVGAVVTETSNVKTLRLVPPSGDGPMPFTFLPGQFLNLTFWIGGAKMHRSYSISSSPMQRGYVDVTVKREPRGAVSRHIDDLLKVGDLIEAGGPIGRFTFTGAEADSIVLIAGGVGITPMMSIARYLTERSWPGDIFFVYASRAPADFIFAKDVTELQRANPRLHVAVTMERAEGTDWPGPRGRLTKEFLAQTVPDIAARRVHLCGPPAMMEAIKAILEELKVPPEQVKTEDFGTAAPTPGGGGTTARSTAPATGPVVTFSKNGRSSQSRAGQTVLELSEELDIGIEFACRVGTCGICKVKLTSGEVDMAVDDALDAEDKANGVILACQAKPRTPITVEA